MVLFPVTKQHTTVCEFQNKRKLKQRMSRNPLNHLKINYSITASAIIGIYKGDSERLVSVKRRQANKNKRESVTQPTVRSDGVFLKSGFPQKKIIT